MNGYGTNTLPAAQTKALVKKYLNSNKRYISTELFPQSQEGELKGNQKIAIPVYTEKDGVYPDGTRADKADVGETTMGSFSTIEVTLEETSEKIVTDWRKYNAMEQPTRSLREVDNLIYGKILADLSLKREVQAKTIATTTTNYNSNNVIEKSGNYWDTSSGDPIFDIETLLNEIMDTTDVMPNILWLAQDAWTAAKWNEKVYGKLPTNVTQMPGTQWFADLFAEYGIEKVVIGTAVDKASDGTTSKLWSDKVGVMYSTPREGEAVFGREYTVRNNVTLRNERVELGTRIQHGGIYMNKFQIINNNAGGLITGILDPS